MKSVKRCSVNLMLALAILLPMSGCEPASSAGAPDGHRVPSHVDSILPMDEEIRRFRAGLEAVDGLAGGAPSREALVDDLIDALERGDSAAVAALSLTRSEFAWLYFSHTMYTAPPYELSPALVWYRQQNRSSRGLTRLLGRYAGEPLYYTGFRCPDEGERFGAGHVWHGCTVLGALPDGREVEERLFGSIMELDGRYKLVSFSNEL